MKRVLIIDDEKDVLNVLSRIIEKLCYVFDTAQTWQKALEFYKSNQYDLVLLDVNMPEKDGFQLACEMKALRPGQKILIITGLGAGDVYARFSECDVEIDGMLYKPFSVRKVKQLVEDTIGPANQN